MSKKPFLSVIKDDVTGEYQITADIPVIFIKSPNKSQYIAYTPALDISTCGNTKHLAEKRFVEMMQLFFEEVLNMGTLEDVLLENGWAKKPEKKTKNKPIIPTYIPPQIMNQTQSFSYMRENYL